MPRPLRTRRQPPSDTIVVKPALVKAATPSPAKKTRSTAAVKPLPEPRPEPTKKTRSKKQTKPAEPVVTKPKSTRSTRQKPAETPEPTTLFSPLQSPSQSSDAENRMPGAAVPSSPPIAQSTPKAVPHDSLDFSSDAGYTPPSQSRKQQRGEGVVLKDLEPRTLRPVGYEDEEEEEEEEEEERLPSPTPKRGQAQRLAEEDTGSPSKRGGTKFHVGDYSQEFVIYSDPKSPSQRTVREDEDLTGIMRPPESDIPWSSSPSRKRGSSEAGMDSGDETFVEVETKATRISKRQKAAAGKSNKSPEVANTEMLRAAIPQRRRTRKPADVFEVSTSDDIDGDEDELSRHAPRKSAPAKSKAKTKGKGKPAKKSPAKKTGHLCQTSPVVTLTREAWGRPLVGGRKPPVSRTYGGRKSLGADEPESEESSDLTPVPSSSGSDTEVVGDGVLHGKDKKRLEKIKHKFQDVDQWALEFEDISASSVSGDSQKR